MTPICKFTLLVAVIILCSEKSFGRSMHAVEITQAVGNGILSCRPGARFPRDCGNICKCSEDGSFAECSANPCPTEHIEFDKANRKVYREWSKLSTEGNDPVFTCKPYTVRKVNEVNGRCFCAKSGITELCSTRRSTPWGGYN